MKLLVIDGNSILYRAFYVRTSLSNRNGIPTNAITGFMETYFKNLNETKPDAVAVAFDRPEPTFRHKATETYKANRKGMPDELVIQFRILRKILELMDISIVECSGYEADDILGTLSKKCSESGNECFILTGDHDSLQLIDEHTTVILTTRGGTVEYTTEKFTEEYGFSPINLIDCKALMGDSSDNISGVEGIGKKTAYALISEYATIENLYEKYSVSGLSKGVKKKLEVGEESAKKSKWLATIFREVPVNTEITDYIPTKQNDFFLEKLLKELDFSEKRIKNFKIKIPDGYIPDEKENDLFEEELVNLGLRKTLRKTEPYESIVITENTLTEETVNNIKECEYIFDGKRLSVRCGNDIFISENSEIILKFMESPCEKTTDDAKRHYRYAMSYDKSLNNVKNDISICGYLLNPSADYYTVKVLCSEYRVHYYSENGDFAEILSLRNLSERLNREIENQNMSGLYHDIEIPLTEVLASMEDKGIRVDKEGVEKFGNSLSVMIAETEKKIFDRAEHEFDIASPKQLSEVLFNELKLPYSKKTKTGYSTNADVLEEIKDKDPIVENVLKYRQYTKLRSTYVVGLLDKVSDDGRIHTWFRQTETRTGRISSTEPNLQNIPVRTELGAKMREFFIADSGKVLIDADYSQIELRVMAHLCGDKNMIGAFNDGEDIHTSTASQVFDVPPIMVTPEMRSTAKAVNFGIIYGIGAFSLAKDINTTQKQAEQYIDDYFRNYSSVKKFLDKTVENAIETGSVTTMFGRKRYIPEITSSNKMIQSAGKRIAMNTPVQGTSADLIKIAMINVYRRLMSEKINAQLILQVHDELIIESDISCADRAKQILREEMQNVCKMKVPLVVDVNSGISWYSAKG